MSDVSLCLSSTQVFHHAHCDEQGLLTGGVGVTNGFVVGSDVLRSKAVVLHALDDAVGSHEIHALPGIAGNIGIVCKGLGLHKRQGVILIGGEGPARHGHPLEGTQDVRLFQLKFQENLQK